MPVPPLLLPWCEQLGIRTSTYQTWKCHGIFVGINFLATEPTAGQCEEEMERWCQIDLSPHGSWYINTVDIWEVLVDRNSTRCPRQCVVTRSTGGISWMITCGSKPLVQAVPMREWRPWQHPFRIHTNLFRWTLEPLSPRTISPSLLMASLKNINKIIQNKLRKKGEAAWERSSSKVYETPEV